MTFLKLMIIFREVVIIKVDGTVTEQTYLIDVSTSDGSAPNGIDYFIGEGDAQRFTIRPDEQSLQFRFEILEDNIILENVECFTISLENAPEVEPRFETQGTVTTSTTTICIFDRTCKITSNYTLYMCEIFFFLVAFVIGFRETLNTVPEDVGSFNIGVAILSPDPVTVDPDITLRVIYSASGTAGIVVIVEQYKYQFHRCK